jgi:hypothetical protein
MSPPKGLARNLCIGEIRRLQAVGFTFDEKGRASYKGVPIAREVILFVLNNYVGETKKLADMIVEKQEDSRAMNDPTRSI